MKQKTQNELIEFAEVVYQEMLDKTQEAEKYRIISDGLENKLKDFIRNNNKSSENLEKFSLNKQKDVETRKDSGKNEGLKELDDIFQKLLLLK
jgi:hypothetical protein